MRLYKSKKIISIIITTIIIISSTNVFADFQAKEPTEEMKNFIQDVDENGKKPLKKPTGQLGESSSSPKHSLDEILKEAKSFITKGLSQGSKIDGNNLKAGSDTLFNILLVIGIFLTVAVGIYLGIKFMASSAEDKAKVKESLVPYIAGCVVIFGAFTIWKLAIVLLSGIA